MTELFSPLAMRGIVIPNRVWVSPMCQYSATDGLAGRWHLVHLGSRAVGGAGLVMAEASAVSPEGRISPWDTGLWNDEQADAFAEIAGFIKDQGSVPAIQLGHAGRKASTSPPWEGGGPLSEEEGGWKPLGPSPLPFGDHPAPIEMGEPEIAGVVQAFAAGAARAARAGFEVVEIHAAHGYLLHSFLSPLSNHRSDRYGGNLNGRAALLVEVIAAVRRSWPEHLPVFVRISATDWAPEGAGFGIAEAVEVSAMAKEAGADLIDCSSGGLIPDAEIPLAPGYQVPFAAAIRKEAEVPTAAVGMITGARQAEGILAEGSADAVFLARAMLADPYWPRRARRELGEEAGWPRQYGRVPTAWD